MTPPTRVVIAGFVPLQADLIRRLLDESPDVSVVATVRSMRSLPDVLSRRPADVVVALGSAITEFVAAAGVLGPPLPPTAVLMLAGGERLVELRFREHASESWPVELVSAVRRAARPEPGGN